MTVIMERLKEGGDPIECSLLRSLAARDAMAPEEVPPELQALITSMEGFKEAADGLAAAAQALGPPPDLRVPGTVMDPWCTEANQHTGLWRSLVRVLEAGHAALLAGTYMIGPELQMALNNRALFPFLCKTGGRQLGAINLHIPMWPVQVLQRAATALFLHTAEPELAEKLDPLAMMERALEGVWPGCTGASPDTDSKEARQARQLLASRHWVPALPEAVGSGSDSGSGISGEAAGPKPPACTALGEDLAAALRQHCPGTSLQDVRRWALLLWLDIGSSAVMTGHPRAPPAQRLLLVCQQALSGLPLTALERARCVHTACKMVCGAELHAAALLAPRGQRLVELVEAGLAEAEAGRVHIRAAALARELSMLLMVRSKGEAGQARAASLARTDELMARCSALVKGCKAWLPASTARQLAALDRHLKQVLAEGARNDATSFAVHTSPDLDLPRCAHCGLGAPHLRACSACHAASYCSRACQVAHWRGPGGHKADCARLAAERGGRGRRKA